MWLPRGTSAERGTYWPGPGNPSALHPLRPEDGEAACPPKAKTRAPPRSARGGKVIGCGLTPRSSGDPPRPVALPGQPKWHIVGCPGKATVRSGRLSANVRPHRRPTLRNMALEHTLGLVVLATLLGQAEARTETLTLRQTQCVDQINERTAAFVAQDWGQVERLAIRYTKDCSAVFGARDDAAPFGDLAVARLKQGSASQALAAADRCIAIFYPSSSCHVSRVQALLASGRVAEARVGLERSERLIIHLLESNSRDRHSGPKKGMDTDLIDAIRESLLAQQSLLQALQERHFPK